MLRDLVSRRRLILRIALADFRGRYSGQVLGAVWAILQPLITIALYTTIFAVVLKVKVGERGDVTDFGLFLICGMLPFNSVGDAIRRSSLAYVEQVHLLRRIQMPPVVLPASRVLQVLFEQGIAFVIFILLLVIIKRPPGLTLLGLAALIPWQVAAALGFAVAAASLTVTVRDVHYLLESLVSIWFLATPIIYPRQLVPAALRAIINANPMTHLVEGYRALILYRRWMSVFGLCYLTGFSLLTLLGGVLIYRRTHATIIDRI